MHEFFIFIVNIYLFALLLKNINKYNILYNTLFVFIITWIIFIYSNPYDKYQNKFTLLSYIPTKYLPTTYKLSNIDINKIQYPVIFKPSRCSGVSREVNLINDIDQAQKYISINNDINDIIVQDFIKYENEVGIFFRKIGNFSRSNNIFINNIKQFIDFANKNTKLSLYIIISREISVFSKEISVFRKKFFSFYIYL